MSSGIQDLQMLRLIKTFQKIADPHVRRMVLQYAEEQLQKQQAKASDGTPTTPG